MPRAPRTPIFPIFRTRQRSKLSIVRLVSRMCHIRAPGSFHDSLAHVDIDVVICSQVYLFETCARFGWPLSSQNLTLYFPDPLFSLAKNIPVVLAILHSDTTFYSWYIFPIVSAARLRTNGIEFSVLIDKGRQVYVFFFVCEIRIWRWHRTPVLLD